MEAELACPSLTSAGFVVLTGRVTVTVTAGLPVSVALVKLRLRPSEAKPSTPRMPSQSTVPERILGTVMNVVEVHLVGTMIVVVTL